MKNLIPIVILIGLIHGCVPSSISLDVKKVLSTYSMFGKNEGRNFYMPLSIGDSLKLKWSAEINGGFPNSSVTTYGNYVFVSDLSGRIYCFNVETGKRAGLLRYSGAVYTTPVIHKGVVIFAVAHTDEDISDLYCYDFREGKLQYEKKISGRIITEIIKAEDGIIFNTENGKVFKLDLLGGKLWEYDTESIIHSSPALGKGIVVSGNDNGEIIGINSEHGTLKYRKKIGESFFGGATVDRNTVYIGNDNGSIFALNLSTGEIIWRYNTDWRVAMIPAFNETDLFAGNLKGEFFSIKKETGELNWESTTGGLLNATPLITQNIIVLPDLNKSFHLIDLKSGKILRTVELGGRCKLSPVIYDDLLFIGYDNGVLNAYEFIN